MIFDWNHCTYGCLQSSTLSRAYIDKQKGVGNFDLLLDDFLWAASETYRTAYYILVACTRKMGEM